jgi:hypothetical protein
MLALRPPVPILDESSNSGYADAPTSWYDEVLDAQPATPLGMQDVLRQWWVNVVRGKCGWQHVACYLSTDPNDLRAPRLARGLGFRYRQYEILIVYRLRNSKQSNKWCLRVLGAAFIKTLTRCKETDTLSDCFSTSCLTTPSRKGQLFAQCNITLSRMTEQFLWGSVIDTEHQADLAVAMQVCPHDNSSDHLKRPLCMLVHRLIQKISVAQAEHRMPSDISLAEEVGPYYLQKLNFGSVHDRVLDAHIRLALHDYQNTLEHPEPAQLAGAKLLQMLVELGWPNQIHMEQFLRHQPFISKGSYRVCTGPLSGSDQSWRTELPPQHRARFASDDSDDKSPQDAPSPKKLKLSAQQQSALLVHESASVCLRWLRELRQRPLQHGAWRGLHLPTPDTSLPDLWSVRRHYSADCVLSCSSERYLLLQPGQPVEEFDWQVVLDELPTRAYLLLRNDAEQNTKLEIHAVELLRKLASHLDMQVLELLLRKRHWHRSAEEPELALLVFPLVVFESLERMRRDWVDPLKQLHQHGQLRAGDCWKGLGKEHQDGAVLRMSVSVALQPTEAEMQREWIWLSQEERELQQCEGQFCEEHLQRAMRQTLERFQMRFLGAEAPDWLLLAPDTQFCRAQAEERGLVHMIGKETGYYLLSYRDVGFWLGQRFLTLCQLAHTGARTLPQLLPLWTPQELQNHERIFNWFQHGKEDGVAPAQPMLLSFSTPEGSSNSVVSMDTSPQLVQALEGLLKPKRSVGMPGSDAERKLWLEFANSRGHDLYASFRPKEDTSVKITPQPAGYKRPNGEITKSASFQWSEFAGNQIHSGGAASLVLYCLYKYKHKWQPALVSISEPNARVPPPPQWNGKKSASGDAQQPRWQYQALTQASWADVYRYLRDFYEANKNKPATAIAATQKGGNSNTSLQQVRKLYEQETFAVSDSNNVANKYLRGVRGLSMLPKLALEESPYVRFHPALDHYDKPTEESGGKRRRRIPPAVVFFCVGDEISATPAAQHVVAYQAVWLDDSNGEKLRGVDLNKKSFGPMGPQNAFLWLQPGRLEKLPVVYLAEGPEKALALAAASRYMCVYAALGVGNFHRFKRHLQVRAQDSPTGQSVPVLALCLDHEMPDRDDKEALEKRASSQAVVQTQIKQLEQTGWTVLTYEPAHELRCKDYDDVVRQHGIAALQRLLELPSEMCVNSIPPLLDPQPNGAHGTSEWTRYVTTK